MEHLVAVGEQLMVLSTDDQNESDERRNGEQHGDIERELRHPVAEMGDVIARVITTERLRRRATARRDISGTARRTGPSPDRLVMGSASGTMIVPTMASGQTAMFMTSTARARRPRRFCNRAQNSVAPYAAVKAKRTRIQPDWTTNSCTSPCRPGRLVFADEVCRRSLWGQAFALRVGRGETRPGPTRRPARR